MIKYKTNWWCYDTNLCKNPWKPELRFAVFRMVATSMFGSSLCRNKGGVGLRCQTGWKMSHVVFPALQVSSQGWFWPVAGGTNLCWSVRLMGLGVFSPLLTVALVRPGLLSMSWVRGRLSSGAGEVAAVWMYVCRSLVWYGFCSGWRHHPGFDLPPGLPARLASIPVSWWPDVSSCGGGRNSGHQLGEACPGSALWWDLGSERLAEGRSWLRRQNQGADTQPCCVPGRELVPSDLQQVASVEAVPRPYPFSFSRRVIFKACRDQSSLWWVNGWGNIGCQRDSVWFETWGKNPTSIFYFGKGTSAVSEKWLLLLLKVRYTSGV